MASNGLARGRRRAQHRAVGEDRIEAAAESGYVTTEVAAAGLNVSPRTVRDYIKAGKLEAKPQGEGVERRWLVSVDSLHSLRQSRQASADLPRRRRRESSGGENAAELAAELLATVQDLQYRLGRAEARAELTERAESSVREERDRLIADLERERQRADEERRRGEQLQAQLETLRASQTVAEASEGTEPQPSTEGAQEGVRRPWWRRWFGG
jgi:hypothetical protein